MREVAKNKTRTLLTVAISSMVVAAAIAIPVALGSKSRAVPVQAATGSKSLAAALADRHDSGPPALTQLKRRFGVFRHGAFFAGGSRAHGASGGEPSALTKFMTMLEQSPRYEPSMAVALEAGVYPVVVVAGASTVHLYNGPAGTNVGTTALEGGDMGGVSGPRASVEAEGLWDLRESTGGAIADFGLVPDGDTSVHVSYANGTSSTVPVTNNVAEVTGSRSGAIPSSVSYKSAAGIEITEHIEIANPAPAASAPSE
jgi:hypothetical protein